MANVVTTAGNAVANQRMFKDVKNVPGQVQLTGQLTAADNIVKQAQSVQTTNPQQAIALFKKAASTYLDIASKFSNSARKHVSAGAVVGGAAAGFLASGFARRKIKKHDKNVAEQAQNAQKPATESDLDFSVNDFIVLEADANNQQQKPAAPASNPALRVVKRRYGAVAGAAIGAGVSAAHHAAHTKHTLNIIANRIQICVTALRNLGDTNAANNFASAVANVMGKRGQAIEALYPCFEEYALINGVSEFSAAIYAHNMLSAYEAMLAGEIDHPSYANVYVFMD
jgi:hypothetical protein